MRSLNTWRAGLFDEVGTRPAIAALMSSCGFRGHHAARPDGLRRGACARALTGRRGFDLASGGSHGLLIVRHLLRFVPTCAVVLLAPFDGLREPALKAGAYELVGKEDLRDLERCLLRPAGDLDAAGRRRRPLMGYRECVSEGQGEQEGPAWVGAVRSISSAGDIRRARCSSDLHRATMSHGPGLMARPWSTRARRRRDVIRRPARAASRTRPASRASRSASPAPRRSASAAARRPVIGLRSWCAASARNRRLRSSERVAWARACSTAASDPRGSAADGVDLRDPVLGHARGDVTADRLLGRVLVETLGTEVPRQDRAVQRRAKDGILRGLHDRRQAADGLLSLATLGDVAQEGVEGHLLADVGDPDGELGGERPPVAANGLELGDLPSNRCSPVSRNRRS